MRHLIWLSALLFSFPLLLSSALASQWDTQTGKDRNGKAYVSLSLEQHGFYFALSCKGKQKKHDLQMVLVSDSFPNLYSVDDAEAKLTFRFNLPHGATYNASMKAWYYAGDKAWTGPFSVDSGTLTFFADAKSLTLLNPEGKEVATFTMKGSSTAAKAVRSICMSDLR
ncbi:MAG: hypothetical protein JKY82_10880 [Rhizobiaceae bacterium]|nr:hypothetical protein [Rhizobiaceae bacterium]